ncbi:methyl-accepting chemotaxis protein [Alteromonas sp. A081]|uniref:methyl-accepting chemotaxis protein n=1 Tax=Alteromonas sp. A081 TaxID=3410269 RepID=UPI003B9847FB
MNIRSKLITSFLVAVTVPIIVLVVTTTVQTFTQSRNYFVNSASQEIKQIDNAFELFFEGMKEHVRYLSDDVRVKSAANTSITNYINRSADMTPLSNGDIERNIYEFHGQFREKHPNLLNVYMGTETGGFIQYPAEPMTNYDPRKRPWYEQAKQAGGEAIITSPYQGVSGGPMISIATTIESDSGSVIGVQSIDVTLDTLTRLVNDVKIGESGYVILVDDNGVVLADPRNKSNNFKNVSELQNLAMYKALQTQNDNTFSVDTKEGEVTVTKYSSPNLKWQFIGVIESSDIEAPARSIVTTMMIVLVVMLVLCSVLGVLLADKIVAPILHISRSLKGIADGKGDLTQRLNVKTRDEIGELANYFNQFMNSIGDLISQIKAQAQTLHSSSQDFKAVAESLNQASEKQEQSIEQTATATNQMAAAAQEVARSCVSTQDATEQTDNASQSGRAIIKGTVVQVEQLMALMREASSATDELENESGNINKILNVIRDIAEQTNLLALNAAIESARAGEQGRGFAVVADEVRTLAKRSHGATEEIDSMLNKLVERTRFVSSKMTTSLEQSEQATKQSNEASEIFEKIGLLVKQIMNQITQIATAAEQQHQVSEEISKNIVGMQASTLEVSKASQGLSNNAENLLLLSDDLNDLVGQFKL